MRTKIPRRQAITEFRRPRTLRHLHTARHRSRSSVPVAKLISTSLRLFAALLGVIGLNAFLTVPAGADPADDPCQFAMVFFCRLLPMAPALDGDVDLTKQVPGADPAELPPDSLPTAGICAEGCGQ